MKRFDKIIDDLYVLFSFGFAIYALMYQKDNYQIMFISGVVFGTSIVFLLLLIMSKIKEKRING